MCGSGPIVVGGYPGRNLHVSQSVSRRGILEQVCESPHRVCRHVTGITDRSVADRCRTPCESYLRRTYGRPWISSSARIRLSRIPDRECQEIGSSIDSNVSADTKMAVDDVGHAGKIRYLGLSDTPAGQSRGRPSRNCGISAPLNPNDSAARTMDAR